LLTLTAVIVSGVVGIWMSIKKHDQEIKEAVARGEYEIPIKDRKKENKSLKEADWRIIYPNTIPMLIGDVPVQASVADNLRDRMLGLSNTPFLPEKVVKLFVFNAYGKHSIWMKDMNYPIDIFWVDKSGKILYFEKNVSPDTYPEKTFVSPYPAWYVVEAKAGFIDNHGIKVNDKIKLVRFVDREKKGKKE